MYHNKNPLMRGKASKPMVGILIFALLIPFIPCVPGTPLSGAVYAADGRTDQIGGNLIQNAEFEEDAHIQTDAAAGKWFPNYSGPLTRDTAYSHAGTYSLKVSGRTETYHSAVYRIAGSDLVPGKDYDLGGFAYAVNNTDMLFGMEIIYWNASEGWRSAFITLNAWKTVTGGNWSEFATTLRLARATTDVGNEYAYTLTYGGQTQDFRGVDNFLLNFYFNTAGTDDFWIDSFLLKQTAAPPPSGHANAPNPANDPDNIFNNASVEADDFSAGMTTGKWYPNGATLARDTSYSHSGAASLRVSGRNLFWHRAEYNVEPGKFAQNKNHQLSCYASSLEAARAELRVEVFGYGGGGDGNGYPSASVVWPAVDTAPGQWAALGGTFKVKQVANADEGFYDLEITHDASGLASPLTVTHVKGLSSVRIYVQEAYGEATPRTDLYLDSFLLKPEVAAPPSGHANAPNPADDPENMINNASFENEGNFGTPAAAAAGTWYPSASGPTVARDDTYSHSGAHSLKMTGRTTGAQSPRYKINGADLMLGKKYDVSGFIGVPDDTRALMGMQILAWDSVIYWKSATVNLSLWREVKRADGWTEFSSELMLTREPTATAGDYEYTLTYGRATHKFLAADGNLSLQLYFNTEDTNDLWLDSFLLKPKSGEIPDRPTGIGSYGDTQDTQGNLIQNASFEDDDFAADWGTHDKWYTLPGVGTLARLTDYSHGGSGSLRIGDRVNSSVSAWKSINGSQISLLKDYNISGYVSAREALNAQLSIEVYGYGGGLLGDAYPNGLMRFPPVGTGTGGWDRIGGSFRITSAPNAEHPGKFDLTVTYGPEGFDSPPPFPLSEPASFSILSPVLAQLNEMSALAAAEDLPSFKLVNVHGLSEIRILVGEADESKHLRPDMYADSFLLEEVDRPAPKKPGGHTGAPNPEDDAGNMFRNASIEANDFASDYAVDKWYPAAAGVTLRQVTTYSHSGTASLLVSGRDAFWHRAQYNVEGYRFASGRDYQVSAYASSLENTRAELMIEVFGYGGTEQGNPYPSQWITLSAGDTAPGAWTKLSGAFNIKQSPTSDPGYVDLIVTNVATEESTVIGHVEGLSSVRFYVQEPYSESTPRTDLYLDSFLLKPVYKPVERPAGHTNAHNTESDAENMFRNASFEKNDFADALTTDKWYPVDGAVLQRDTTYSHSGTSSLLVTNRSLFWHRAEYRVEGSNFTVGKAYQVSGYASSLEDATAELMIQVFGYGGPNHDPYPSAYITLSSADTAPGQWAKLSGAFSIRRQALADSGYYDLIVTDGASGETVTIPRVQGLSSVAFYAQEAYDASTPRTDLYLDSFLLKPAAQSVVRPTGHTGAYNTENDPDNLIRNASIETNRFGKLFDAAIWYPNNAALFQDTTYSHSGRASLRIADRNVFWHRAEYRVEGLEIEPDRTYNISGYASSLEETTVDLLLEIGAYGGPENDPYPHQLIYLSDGDTRPGTWTKLSGSFQITETPTADRDYFDYTITHSASGERLTIPHVKGISMANVMVQEKYSAAEKRTDLYLDSFLFKGAPKNPARPAGHAGAGNPQNDPGNLIRNGSFETDSFSQKLQTGLWWPAVPGVNLTRLSDYSHSGSHSLMVSGRGEHWHMAMYRVGAEDLSVGHEYELSGYFSSLEKTRANLEITFWNALPGSNGQWASDTMILDHGSIAPGTWTKLGATFKLTKEGDSYVIACNGQSIRIPARYGIGCIEILPLLTPGTFNRKTDMYLDSFLMKDTTPKPSFPQLKGHANEPDTEDIDGNLINNAGFEADLLWNDINFGLWFTNGAGYDVRFVDGFSHSGKQSVQIYNRKNGANTLLYRVEAGSIQYGAEYELSGWVAAAAKAKAKLMLQVYGYDGRGGYPAQTVPLSSAGVGQTFSNLKGTFAILYEDGVLYLNTAGGKTKIGACKGLSGIEFWVETEEEGLWPPDLYLDSFSLLIGRTAGNLSIAGAGADPEINSVMQGDSVEAILTGFSTPGSAGAGADGIVLIVSCAVILASAALIAIRLLKRRKAAQSAGEAG